MTTTTRPATHTHTGYRGQVGYRHIGRDFNHYEPKAGKVHALNGTSRPYEGAVYTAVCGVRVVCEDDGVSLFNVKVGGAVTCKQCKAREAVLVDLPKRTKFAVMY